MFFVLFCAQTDRPWNHEMDRVLERAYEAGLALHLIRKPVSLTTLNSGLDIGRVTESHTRFTLEHVFIAILCIFVGNGMAIMVFGAEMCGLFNRGTRKLL